LFDEQFSVRGGRVSPEGRFIAYSSDESKTFQAHVGILQRSSSGTLSAVKGPQISVQAAAGGLFWPQSGKELFFLAIQPQQAMMAVDISTDPAFQASAPRLLFKLPTPMLGPAQLSGVASRDGERFVFLVQPDAAK
jgi:hypothetical protein